MAALCPQAPLAQEPASCSAFTSTIATVANVAVTARMRQLAVAAADRREIALGVVLRTVAEFLGQEDVVLALALVCSSWRQSLQGHRVDLRLVHGAQCRTIAWHKQHFLKARAQWGVAGTSFGARQPLSAISSILTGNHGVCTSLVSLSLVGCAFTRDASLRTLLSALRGLHQLCIKNPAWETSEEDQDKEDPVQEPHQRQCQQQRQRQPQHERQALWQAADLAAIFRGPNTLARVTLDGCGLTRACCKVIADGLKCNRTLRDLTLRGACSEGSEQDEFDAALGEALKKNKTLTSLALCEIRIGVAGAKGVGSGLKHNTTLTKLTMDGAGLKDAGAVHVMEGLRANRTLQWLSLNYSDFGSHAAIDGMLKENKGLTMLNVSDNGLSRIGSGLERNCTLTELDLGFTDIGAESAIELADSLRTNAHLTSLSLEGCQIEDRGAVAFARCLKTNRKLKALWLAENHIADLGLTALAGSLREHPTVSALSLGRNRFTDTGLEELFNALAHNRSLERLSLFESNVGKPASSALARMLRTNAALRTLNLRASSICDAGLAAIGSGLQENQGIEFLVLVENKFRDTAALEFVRQLRLNSGLRGVDLRLNDISAAVAAQIANMDKRVVRG